MRSWWRLVALIIMVAFSFTMYPALADADMAGIFDSATNITDLDDDFDEILRRFKPKVDAHAAAGGFDSPAPHLACLSATLAGPGPVSWTGRLPVGRGPPQACARSIESASGVLPYRSVHPPYPEHYSPASTLLAASPPAPRFRQALPAVSNPPGSSSRLLASSDSPTPPRVHRQSQGKEHPWPR